MPLLMWIASYSPNSFPEVGELVTEQACESGHREVEVWHEG